MIFLEKRTAAAEAAAEAAREELLRACKQLEHAAAAAGRCNHLERELKASFFVLIWNPSSFVAYYKQFLSFNAGLTYIPFSISLLCVSGLLIFRVHSFQYTGASFCLLAV